MTNLRLLNLFILASLIAGCTQTQPQNTSVPVPDDNVKYAKGFSIEYYDDYKKVTVSRLYKGSSQQKIYYLYSDSASQLPGDGIKIKTPLQSIVCTSTTHLPSLVLLDEVDKLVGFPSLEYISSNEVRERINSGSVKELGSENGMDIEGIVDLSPDVMMGFLMSSDSKVYDKIEGSGVNVVINSDYLENSPLGRAEWIKFVAAFFNKEELADSIFTAIEDNYFSIKNLVLNVPDKPAVFSGILYGGTWFMPGGDSFAAIFLQDAGANFLWSDTNETGSLELSFESVLEKAEDAEYWIGASNFKSREDMLMSDERYELFKAFKENNVFTYTLNVTEFGGNDFFEMGYARPDWILSDLVKILHPGLIKDEAFHFYQQVK